MCFQEKQLLTIVLCRSDSWWCRNRFCGGPRCPPCQKRLRRSSSSSGHPSCSSSHSMSNIRTGHQNRTHTIPRITRCRCIPSVIQKYSAVPIAQHAEIHYSYTHLPLSSNTIPRSAPSLVLQPPVHLRMNRKQVRLCFVRLGCSLRLPTLTL